MRALHTRASRAWLAAGFLLTGLVFAQLGVAQVLSTLAEACCPQGCPCDSEAAAISDAGHAHDHGAAPSAQDAAAPECAPGCDDCACSPASAIAATATAAPLSQSPRSDAALLGPSDVPPSGVVSRVFRPPEPSCV